MRTVLAAALLLTLQLAPMAAIACNGAHHHRGAHLGHNGARTAAHIARLGARRV